MLKLKNPEMYVFQKTMTPLSPDQATFTMKIPKQLPDDVDEEALMTSAKSLQSAFEGIVIILIIAMAILGVDPT